MAPIADERLDQVAAVVGARKVTPAAVRVVDVPGTGAALLGNLRQVDALLAVLDGHSQDATPDDDLETLHLELLVADRDHVEKRLERVRTQAKSGDPRLRAEVGELEKLLAHVDAGGRVADYPGELPPELEPLTTEADHPARQRPRRHRRQARGRARRAARGGGGRLPRRAVGAGGGRPPAVRGARPDQLLHGRREGDAGLDAAARGDRPRRRRDHPHRHRARLHPRRGDPLERPRRGGLARRGVEARAAASRGQELRRRGRRRAEHPLQHLGGLDETALSRRAALDVPRRRPRSRPCDVSIKTLLIGTRTLPAS